MDGLKAESSHRIQDLIRLKCRHGYYIRVTDDCVEGIKDENDEYTILEIDSVAQEGISIRGTASKKYVGMDNVGNLLTYGTLIEDCVFIEKQTERNGYPTSFVSRSSVGWYLALRKDGRAKPGLKTAPGQKAVAFLKVAK